MAEFTDQTSPSSGTPLDAQYLNALTVDQSYLISGAAPSLGGLASSVVMPAQTFVINGGAGSAQYFAPSTTSIGGTPTNSVTNYIDALSTGAGYVWNAGAVSGTNLRLYSVAVNGSGYTSGTATLLAPTFPISVSMLPAAMALGVATLDGNTRVLQAPAVGVRSVTVATPTTDLMAGQSAVNTYTGYAAWESGVAGGGVIYTMAFTIGAGSTIKVELAGVAWNNISVANNWLSLGCAVDATGNAYLLGYAQSALANAAFGAPHAGAAIITGLAAGAHTLDLLGAAGGTSGATATAGFMSSTHGATAGQPCYLTITITEFA